MGSNEEKEGKRAATRKAAAGEKRKPPAASPAAMGSRAPRGTGSSAAVMGRGSRSPSAPNPCNLAAALFPAGPAPAGCGSSSGGWGYPKSGGSSHGGGPFISSPSSNGFPIPPSQSSHGGGPVWWEASGVGSPSNWDPTWDKETYPPGGFMRPR